MLSVEQNKLLTQVGPGTPTGELMRRYWHPIAGSAEMRENPTKGVRILGEDLVLYKDRSGGLGLIQESCPHRRVNLLYGIPEQQGIRCPYHGWLFDESGRCLEMPAEAPDSTFKDRVTARTYPVQELGGLIFAYLGPKPAPAAAPVGPPGVGERGAGHRRVCGAVQLAAMHGELPGPDAHRVAARLVHGLHA